MTNPDPEDLVERTLGEASRPEPPADLAGNVMRQVTAVEAGLPAWRRWRDEGCGGAMPRRPRRRFSP